MASTSPEKQARKEAAKQVVAWKLAALMKDMSKADLARKAGIARSTVTEILSAKRGATPDQLASMAKVVGCEMGAIAASEAEIEAQLRGLPLSTIQIRLATPAQVESRDLDDRSPGSTWIRELIADIQRGLEVQPGLAEFFSKNADNPRLTFVIGQCLAAHRTKPDPTKNVPRDNDYWWRAVTLYEQDLREEREHRAKKEQPKA
jgi:transcriptional regulator with XRE-family HTH domain